jgi:H+-transporting ATPase
MVHLFVLLLHVRLCAAAVLLAAQLTLCSYTFYYLISEGEEVRMALSFTVVLLVASIPVAIEIVCTTTLALGSHQLSEQGAIVSRLPAIEDLAGMTILCSDKTGTLTMNKMVIQEETPVYAPGETQYSILR